QFFGVQFGQLVAQVVADAFAASFLLLALPPVTSGLVPFPFAVTAVPPLGKVLGVDGLARKILVEHRAYGGLGVQPRQDFRPRMLGANLAVQRFANIAVQGGNLAIAGGIAGISSFIPFVTEVWVDVIHSALFSNSGPPLLI